jgi:hypothetical protein
MGVEGKDKVRVMESGAHALSGQLGKTIQRLRKAYHLSLSELADLATLAGVGYFDRKGAVGLRR